jgi:threonine aldolase
MGNLASMLAHCQRGDEVILGKWAHTYLFEAGGISVLGGVHSCQIPNQPDGTLTLEDIRASIRADDPHQPITRLIALENTHNRCGGAVLSAEYTHQVADFAHSRGLKLHIDGARLFNAAVALGIPAKELSGPADSVTFCLSKALCAPVGSVITGSKDFIARAHRIRKMLGGGMRQAGVLAAAGIVALETMIDRLAEDHARARRLAADMKNLPGLVLDPGSPQTNMIFCSLAPELPLSASQVAARMQEQCVKIGITGSRRFRLVLHYWIDDAAVEKAVEAFKSALTV